LDKQDSEWSCSQIENILDLLTTEEELQRKHLQELADNGKNIKWAT
jgi:hypothetical protein